MASEANRASSLQSGQSKAAVERAQRSPSARDHEITAMKREKLRLKEQINRLGH